MSRAGLARYLLHREACRRDVMGLGQDLPAHGGGRVRQTIVRRVAMRGRRPRTQQPSSRLMRNPLTELLANGVAISDPFKVHAGPFTPVDLRVVPFRGREALFKLFSFQLVV